MKYGRLCSAFLLISALAGAGETAGLPAGFEEDRVVETDHFRIYHEAAYAPVGITGVLEGLRAKLLLDLQDLAPWAVREKIAVFVYAGEASYVEKTGVPAWAAAFADPEKRRIHCYESPHLQRILSHEMAHLFVGPYFAETGGSAPAWLNEGIAKMMEWNYGQEEDTALMNRHSFLRNAPPLPEVIAFDYHRNFTESASLSVWYEQSASVTAYLLHRLPRASFTMFCDALRRGATTDEALHRAYGNQVPDVAALESLWRDSLSEK
jgi:hypothetical protein